MPYAVRNLKGEIVSLHRYDPGVGDELPADHPQVREFLGLDAVDGMTSIDEDFGRLDADFIRVLEDVIDAMVSRNMLNITDLPESAQTKLFARKSFRDRRPKSALDLFKPSIYGDVI